jgi:acyl-CoA reductase-like NAD-dependent aldehyde dehydrogenase
VPASPSALAAHEAARLPRHAWGAQPLAARAAVIDAAACLMAVEADALVSAIAAASARPATEVWSGEIVPAIDALRWLARDGAKALRPRALSRAHLQWYFRAARHQLSFEPHGVVGVVTPSNSPLFLSVPQIAAALLAGNVVVWKPAPRGGVVAARVAALFQRAGLPPGALRIVEGGAEAARDLVAGGVDKLHFTGGAPPVSSSTACRRERGGPRCSSCRAATSRWFSTTRTRT